MIITNKISFFFNRYKYSLQALANLFELLIKLVASYLMSEGNSEPLKGLSLHLPLTFLCFSIFFNSFRYSTLNCL